ncbi:MAG: YerC/YecD family TrpR-related protein [Candidatus Izemoplasmatales bacterium]
MYKSRFANKDIDDLFTAILKLENQEECYRFFEDLCTIKEVQDMAQRLKVAKLLQNKVSYQEIANETKASTATISRVNKSLIYGAEGYHLIMKKLNDDQD